MDHAYACKDLRKWSAHKNRKRKLFENAEILMKKLVKSLWVNLFSAGFSDLETLCSAELS
jgi:DNA-binding ferritin-like protein (Dps family)